MVDKGKPEAGKVYSLTGGHGTPSIASGNTWAESEVKEDNVLGDGTRQTEKNKIVPVLDARDHHQIMKKGIVRPK
jgi:UDP-N-acetylglucosamine:LPS N-acetylglucosamine transferase